MSGRTAAILGTGLIGASVGLGLRASGWRIVGWDPDRTAADTALGLGALDLVASDRDAAVETAEDLVVLAGPPGAIVADLPGITTALPVTDVAGVKVPIVAAAAHLEHFVGGHPMAGRETSGPRSASPALFRGAVWVLVTDAADPGDVDYLGSVVAELGANPVLMSAAEHDAAVAVVSHLPQVLAAALLEEATSVPGSLDLAAGSFRDLTRVAASDPDAWRDLLTANREAAGAAIRRFSGRLADWAGRLDAGAIGDALATAREVRRSLAPPVVAVRVALSDRPGELAKVGHALAASEVDVRDLQLRHGPHGGGGILTLSVRPGEAEALRAALHAVGLETVA